jgi:luciferase family oxidoreductase group 1
VPVRAGSTTQDALRESVELARLAERLGYVRYWFAEHHGMASIASSAPEILIGHIASATSRIRVGSGGIMLPNHAPLRVAEVFHTLQALHSGRIDLGIGRAPGTDPATSRALRPFDSDQFAAQVHELLGLSRRTLSEDHPFARVRVVPGDVALPPVWVLASSGATAAFAGSLGLGYAFARHFSPNPPGPAIRAYRERFTPSADFPQSHVVVGVSVVCAPTDEEADYLAGSSDLAWVRLHRGEFGLPLPSPEEAAQYAYSAQERVVVDANRLRHFIGSPPRVAGFLRHLAEETGADEMMVTSAMYGKAERFRSYEMLAEEWGLAAQDVDRRRGDGSSDALD